MGWVVRRLMNVITSTGDNRRDRRTEPLKKQSPGNVIKGQDNRYINFRSVTHLTVLVVGTPALGEQREENNTSLYKVRVSVNFSC